MRKACLWMLLEAELSPDSSPQAASDRLDGIFPLVGRHEAEGRSMPLPQLSDEDRARAREKALAARRARAEVKQRLKNGALTLNQVLDSEDEIIRNTKVMVVLESLPGVGKVRARKIMEKLDIASTRKIKGLGRNQRTALLGEFQA